MTLPDFARRTRRMDASAIREVLKVASRPGMISLAGGLPAAEAFPMSVMPELTRRALDRYGAAAFQYGPTEGFDPLRRALADVLLPTRGIDAAASDLLVTSGSQGVLDALGKIMISPGDRVAVESPTYLGALQAFTPYEPVYAGLETDDHGVIPESLEAVLAQGPLKLVYLVPNFQNPSGRTLSLPRRRRLAGIARQHGLLIVEDDPYGDLRYEGRQLPSLRQYAPDHVVYAGTLSKVMAPGLRVGYCLAPAAVRRWLVLAKQGVDLHTGTFSQALAAEYIAGGHWRRQLPKIIACYRPRRDAMLESLDERFPETFRWSRPEGGMFVWVEGPGGTDTRALYAEAVSRGVAFVPGNCFYPERGRGGHALRLNFTMADVPAIRRAVGVLAGLFRNRAGKSASGPGRRREPTVARRRARRATPPACSGEAFAP